jgi:hypothetical protein
LFALEIRHTLADPTTDARQIHPIPALSRAGTQREHPYDHSDQDPEQHGAL